MSADDVHGRSRAATRALALLALAAAAVTVLLIVSGSGSDREPEQQRGGGAQTRSGEREADRPLDEVYVVEPGDTFSGIAEKTGVPLERLERLNPDVDPQVLNAGQEIRLRR